MKNIVILISGGGSNMKAILQHAKDKDWGRRFGAFVSCVISNKEEAKGLSIAQEYGVKSVVVSHQPYKDDVNPRQGFEQELIKTIDKEEPFLVVLAGFMRILTPHFVNHFEGRLVNIHPSLLPAFTGLHTHQRAIEMGCRFAGATVHRVTQELDTGPILAQAVVPVLKGDTEKDLAARVLTQEHLIYPRAIEDLLALETR
jgi:phosphoribosylglycinamide formyltransferase-1